MSPAAPDLAGRPVPSPNDTVLQLLVLTIALVVCGPLCCVLSACLVRWCRTRQSWRVWLLLAITGALAAMFLHGLVVNVWVIQQAIHTEVTTMLSNKPPPPTTEPIWRIVLRSWWHNLLLSPLGALLLEGWRQLDEVINGKPLAALLEDDQRLHLRREEAASQQAAGRVPHVPPPQAGYLSLGPYVVGKTDHFPRGLGILTRRQWLVLHEDVLDQHLFILGAPGAGKSETIKRLLWEILSQTERDVFFVDGKGEEPLAQVIRALAYAAGRGVAPIFRLGAEQSGARYHGFAGQAAAVYSRLVALAGVMELEGNADIYGRITRDLLQLVCYSPQGPPRSFEELRQRLTTTWLRKTYQHDLLEGEIVKDKNFEQRLEGVQLRLRPLMREFTPLTGSDGFSLEESRAAIFSIRTQSLSDTASYFLQFLVEDLKDFINKRQQRPAVLVIDEFGAFGNKNIIKLLSLARSAKLGIILATQDIANLGDESTIRSILANTGTKLLMRSDFPEDIAKLAGTIFQLEGSSQYDQGKATGLGSVRPQHTFKIDMNEAARLSSGEAFLIRHRHIAKLKIAALDNEWLAQLLAATPAETIASESAPVTNVAGEPSQIRPDRPGEDDEPQPRRQRRKQKNID